MITKYKTNYSGDKIEKVEVLRETEKMVYVKRGWRDSEYREAKMSENGAYFDTWEDAHAHILSVAKAKVDSARRSLELANSKHGNIKGMKAP